MAHKNKPYIDRGTDNKGNHHISTVVPIAWSGSIEVTYFNGTHWPNQKVEYVSLDDGNACDDNNTITFESLEQAQDFHKALGVVLAEAKLWKASQE